MEALGRIGELLDLFLEQLVVVGDLLLGLFLGIEEGLVGVDELGALGLKFAREPPHLLHGTGVRGRGLFDRRRVGGGRLIDGLMAHHRGGRLLLRLGRERRRRGLL